MYHNHYILLNKKQSNSIIFQKKNQALYLIFCYTGVRLKDLLKFNKTTFEKPPEFQDNNYFGPRRSDCLVSPNKPSKLKRRGLSAAQR